MPHVASSIHPEDAPKGILSRNAYARLTANAAAAPPFTAGQREQLRAILGGTLDAPAARAAA